MQFDRVNNITVAMMNDKILTYIQLFSLCAICFIGGVLANSIGAANFVRDAVGGIAGLAWIVEKEFFRENTYESKARSGSFWWQKSRYPDKQGAYIYQAEKLAPGYTLYGSAHQEVAYLIDHSGAVKHQWSFDYGKQIGLPFSTGKMQARDVLFWRDVFLYPNGDLLAITEVNGESPWGVSLIKLDKDSNLLWEQNKKVHHDLVVAEDGRIFVLGHEIVHSVEGASVNLVMPIYDERLLVLAESGEVLQEISITRAIANSPYRYLIENLRYTMSGDYLHANTIKYLDKKLADQVSYVKENQVLVHLRNLEVSVIIDLATEKVMLLLYGPWKRAHDPEILPNGNILVFDNKGLGEGRSRVIEFNPLTQEIVWEYKGTDEHPLYSAIRSREEKQANGNIVIVESDGARLLEVSPEGELLWEFYNPHRVQYKDQEYVPIISGGRRYTQEYVQFLSPQQK